MAHAHSHRISDCLPSVSRLLNLLALLFVSAIVVATRHLPVLTLNQAFIQPGDLIYIGFGIPTTKSRSMITSILVYAALTPQNVVYANTLMAA